MGNHPYAALVKVCYLCDADTANRRKLVELGAFKLWLLIKDYKAIMGWNIIIFFIQPNATIH